MRLFDKLMMVFYLWALIFCSFVIGAVNKEISWFWALSPLWLPMLILGCLVFVILASFGRQLKSKF